MGLAEDVKLSGPRRHLIHFVSLLIFHACYNLLSFTFFLVLFFRLSVSTSKFGGML
jgi:hypothetical protein